MIAYILVPGSGVSYAFTSGSLIAVAVLVLMGWLLHRFLLRKFAHDQKDLTHAKD
jgi:flagellar biogenesis protein FliO